MKKFAGLLAMLMWMASCFVSASLAATEGHTQAIAQGNLVTSQQVSVTSRAKQPTISKITIGKPKKALRVGENQRIAVTMKGSGAAPKLSDIIVYSSNPGVAQLVNHDKKGLMIMPQGIGSAQIVVECFGKKQAATFHVNAYAPIKVELDRDMLTIQKGKTHTLVGTVMPREANQKLAWSSGNSSVAKVSKTGIITGVKQGKTLITAKADNGIKYQCMLTVQNDPVYIPTWGEWGAWQDARESTNADKEEQSRYVHPYYYYRCSYCGAHMHVYTSCYKWAGGCGRSGGMSYSSGFTPVWSTTSYAAAGLKDWHGTGRLYAYVDGQLAFKWTDNVYPKWQYRYRTRR